MLTQTEVVAATEPRETRELEEILATNQLLTDRLGRIDERLAGVICRLSGGVSSEVATEGAELPPTGIIGQLKTTHTVFFRHCDSIEEWLTHIEKVI